jgi:hypothetical protein
MADQVQLAILWLGTFELAREKGCQEFALNSDAIGIAAEICGISKQLNVELVKVVILQKKCWKFSPRSTLAGIEAVHEDDQSVPRSILTDPFSQVFGPPTRQ